MSNTYLSNLGLAIRALNGRINARHAANAV